MVFDSLSPQPNKARLSETSKADGANFAFMGMSLCQKNELTFVIWVMTRHRSSFC
ncbi:hypothetical protein [Moraxella lacunata]|uniref:hypothetical protein n=1 Tax=Moraxella lacunata TaxID=477 RepID=UPI003EE1E33C